MELKYISEELRRNPERNSQHTLTVNNQGNFHWTTQIINAQEVKCAITGVSETNKSDPFKGIPKAFSSSPTAVVTPEKPESVNEVSSGSTVIEKGSKPKPADASVTPPGSGSQKQGPGENTVKPGSNPAARVELPLAEEPLGDANKPEGTGNTSLKRQNSYEELLAMQAHNLNLLRRQKEAPATDKPAQSISVMEQSPDKAMLDQLKQAVANATSAYVSYSNGIWFSLFHRHGNAGRVRANTFNDRFAKIDDLNVAKKELIAYLNNSKNGNTHPHSYRTMLLQEMLVKNPKPSLQVVSRKFSSLLLEQESAQKVSLTEVDSPSVS